MVKFEKKSWHKQFDKLLQLTIYTSYTIWSGNILKFWLHTLSPYYHRLYNQISTLITWVRVLISDQVLAKWILTRQRFLIMYLLSLTMRSIYCIFQVKTDLHFDCKGLLCALTVCRLQIYLSNNLSDDNNLSIFQNKHEKIQTWLIIFYLSVYVF